MPHEGVVGRRTGLAAGWDAGRGHRRRNRPRGHVEVLPDCTLPEHPEVFVVGDMMSLNGLPGVAEVAMQSGIHAARTIKRRLQGDSGVKPFAYRDLGSMATISRFRAIVSFKGIKVGGFIGWMMWAFVHITFSRASRTAGSPCSGGWARSWGSPATSARSRCTRPPPA